MTPSPVSLWCVRRLLADQPISAELAAVETPVRNIVDHLAGLSGKARQAAWDAFLCAPGFDRDAIGKALAEIDPAAPAPTEPRRAFATVADIRRTLSATRWLWEGWIPSARIIGIGGFEGTGKTRFALDLCRRIYHGLDWPDGQAPTLPKGTRSVWMCSDAHQDELADMLPAFGLPDEAMVFPTAPEEPYGGTDLDNPETLDALGQAIAAVRPGLVFVDTLTSATSKDLCDQRSMKPLKAPLADLVQTYQVSIVLQLHLSKEGQALGRRIKGITRTLVHLEAPDPDQPSRLRLWVEKSYAKRPPAMGVTMHDAGNDYDLSPPRAPEPNRAGRPAKSRNEAQAFIAGRLSASNDQRASTLCAEWASAGNDKNAFWRARDAMVEAGELVCDGKPLVLHLVS